MTVLRKIYVANSYRELGIEFSSFLQKKRHVKCGIYSHVKLWIVLF